MNVEINHQCWRRRHLYRKQRQRSVEVILYDAYIDGGRYTTIENLWVGRRRDKKKMLIGIIVELMDLEEGYKYP